MDAFFTSAPGHWTGAKTRIVGVALSLFTALIAAGASEPTPLHDDAALRDVQFTSAGNGYAVGDHGAVWKTNDGGKTWQFVPTPTKASLRSASFLTDQIGFVAGVEWVPFARLPMGVLLKTADGGKTWTPVGDGMLPGLEHVRFFDLEEGVAVGRASPSGPSGVWTTTDGGNTWKPVNGPNSPAWRAARFVAPDLGIIAGADGQLSLVGGEQLLPARIPSLGNRTVRDVTINADAAGWLVGEGGLVLATNSGGVSWQTPAGALPESVPAIFDFHCVEQRGLHVWLAGAPGSVIWHSPDAGKTWTSHPTGQPTPIHRLRFTSDSHGVAVGALGSILSTRDGGESWQAVRGGQRRAAVLMVPSRTRRVAPELLAPVSLEQGFRTVLHAPVNTTTLEGFASRDAAEELLATTIQSLGGSAAEIGRQLAVDLPGLDRDAEKLQARWQAQSEGRAAQTLVGSLVRELRMWRPSVVLIEEPAINDVYGEWLRQAVLAAVSQARDATRELDQIDVGGLSTWAVDRVYMQLPPGSQGEVTYDLQTLLPRAGNSAQLLAAASRSLWEPALPPRDALAFRCVLPTEKSPITGDLFAGLNLAPGSAARRALGAMSDSDLEAAQRRVQRTRNLVAIADKAERGSPTSAQLVTQWPTVAKEWPPEQAAELLAEAAQRFRRETQFEHAEAVYLDLVRRYPQQPAALDGMRWLLQYWTSAEVAWQRQHARGAMQVQWTNDAAGVANRVEQAQAAGSDFLAAPRTVADVMQARASKSDRGVANRKPTLTGAPPDSLDIWRKRAAELAQQLEDQSPALFQQPEIQFPLAALKRARGSAGQADSVYRRFQLASPDDAARQLVDRELWLGAASPEVPRKIISCKPTSSRPHLDGLLSDPCWQQAQEVLLGVGWAESSSPTTNSARKMVGLADSAHPAASQGMVMFAYDAEFLYIAASVPRHPDASPDPPRREGRTHDADLSQHDRLGIALDIDRDYSTWYELRVDQRGWTSDRCWEDDGWDPQWYVAAEGDESRWRMEVAIPWNELSSQPPQPREAWAVSLVRTVPALVEYGWGGAGHWPPRWDQFGLLRFEGTTR